MNTSHTLGVVFLLSLAWVPMALGKKHPKLPDCHKTKAALDKCLDKIDTCEDKCASKKRSDERCEWKCDPSRLCNRQEQKHDKCTERWEKGVLKGIAHCAASSDCPAKGLCVSNGFSHCVPGGSSAACERAQECATQGHCTWFGARLWGWDRDPAKTKGGGDLQQYVVRLAKRSPPKWGMVVGACGHGSDADCQRYPGCEKSGLCKFRRSRSGRGVCTPGSAAECRKSL
jgi:hypothetical protein